jgi:hypothetical protein
MRRSRLSGLLFLAPVLAGMGCGKPCNGWSFHSRCEGNVAPQCLGTRLETTHVVRVDCSQTGMVCANPETGEHARQAFCYPALGTCDPAAFVPGCGPYSRVTRCVRGHVIEGEESCRPSPVAAPRPADAGIEPAPAANSAEAPHDGSPPEQDARKLAGDNHPVCQPAGH